MAEFQLTIQTPIETLFEGTVDSLRIKTDLGRMEVLPDNATIVGMILYSKVFARHSGQEEKFIIRHGSVSVDEKGNTTVLALEAHKEAEMTVKTMEEYLQYLGEQLKNPDQFNDYQKQFLEEQRDALQQGIEDKSE